MNTEKAVPRVQRFADLQYAPRFEYGHMAEVAEVYGARDGTELIYEAQSALVHYAIHPSNWHQSK